MYFELAQLHNKVNIVLIYLIPSLLEYIFLLYLDIFFSTFFATDEIRNASIINWNKSAPLKWK